MYPLKNERGGVHKLNKGFAGQPLTLEQRKQLGVDKYYRPFRIDAKEAVKDRRKYWLVKRSFDLVAASVALFVLSPLLLVCMAAIWIEDPKGSPIFVQDRVGRGGKLFRFYKLRSMHVDAEEKLADLLDENEFMGKAFKIKDDPRITRVGKFLRNTSLDELPQLVNIIKGDMSVVGPRPPLPREVENYDDYEVQRLIVTPGLTCFWQVYPRRHEISFEDWVALDVKYVEERSFKIDIELIFKTVLRVLKGHTD